MSSDGRPQGKRDLDPNSGANLRRGAPRASHEVGELEFRGTPTGCVVYHRNIVEKNLNVSELAALRNFLTATLNTARGQPVNTGVGKRTSARDTGQQRSNDLDGDGS